MKAKIFFEIIAVVFLTTFLSCSKPGAFFDDHHGHGPGTVEPDDDEINVLIFRDSTANDHEMIQMAIDYAHDHNIAAVYVPDGVYMIDAAGINGSMGVLLRDSIHFKMADNAVLKAIANDTTTYYVVRVHDAQNVRISGGSIVGDRDTHLGTGGEWGMGIDLRNTSGVSIDNVKISDCWGDGIYIGKGTNEFIRIRDVVCDNNRRQGLSITNADSITVLNSVFKNTNGTLPEAGIDLEPNQSNSVSRILIDDCVFENNGTSGLSMVGLQGTISQISVTGSMFSDNKTGIMMVEQVSDVNISDVDISGTQNEGIRMREVSDIVITDIDITDFVGKGIHALGGCENIDFQRIKTNTDDLIALGFAITDSKAISLTGSEVIGGKYGIWGVDSEDITVDSTLFLAQDASGIRLTRVRNSSFENLFTKDIITFSIALLNSDNNVFSGCLFEENIFPSHNVYNYFFLDGTSNNNQFVNNTIAGGTSPIKARYGVRLKPDTYDNLISGNTIDPSAYATSAVTDEGGNNIVNQ